MLVWLVLYSPADFPSRCRMAVAKKRRLSGAKGMSLSRRNLMAVPVWATSSATSSSMFASMRSASLLRMATRSGIQRPRQRASTNASRAALTARSTSSAVPLATRPTTRPVAGLRTSTDWPLDDATHAPPMSCWYSVTVDTAMISSSGRGEVDTGFDAARASLGASLLAGHPDDPPSDRCEAHRAPGARRALAN